MGIAIHDSVVTGFSHTLRSLSGLLDTTRAHATAMKYEPAVLLQARLFPDMFPLLRQIQLATDFAKGAAARLAGHEVPKWEDTEQNLDDLQRRIEKTIDYLASFGATQFEGAEARAIELKTPAGTFSFTGRSFLLQWAIPNFYFHAATAYGLLRHNGVPVGKLDFLGALEVS